MKAINFYESLRISEGWLDFTLGKIHLQLNGSERVENNVIYWN